ncbi:MAG TPA: Rieske 2Fe-2S domain-containing protein [Candidatus Binatia bacterium]|jgi:5,5'-dehydrodivanillate O-demethylase
MITQEENDLLTGVGPGTPGGQLLRRYWHVIAAASELTPQKAKKKIRVLGEDLVLYRDRSGAYGLVAEHCAHRGASLYYGFVEDDGIRCAYHGWKYDACGNCLEQPFETPEVAYKEEIRHPAYPVEKLAGLLFTYLGPPEKKPLLPKWDILTRRDGVRRLEIYQVLRCNWLQAMENSVDPVHTYYLHAHTLRLRGTSQGQYYYRPLSKLDFELEVHSAWAGIQKRRVFAGDAGRVEAPHPLIFPNMLLVPATNSYNMHFRTPIDDTHTQIFHVRFNPTQDGSAVEQPENPPAEFVRTKNEAGEFHMENFPSQDQMAWETQGPIANRPNEHLGESDRGIIIFRKFLRDQLRAVQNGGDPLGINRDPAKDEVIRLIPEGYTAFSEAAAQDD